MGTKYQTCLIFFVIRDKKSSCAESKRKVCLTPKKCACVPIGIEQNNMAEMAGKNSELVSEVILEDQLVDIWPQYPCLYDVRSSEFKNRDARDKALQEIAEKLGQTG